MEILGRQALVSKTLVMCFATGFSCVWTRWRCLLTLARLSTIAELAATIRPSEEAQSRCRPGGSTCRPAAGPASRCRPGGSTCKDALAIIQSDTHIVHNTISLNIASLRQPTELYTFCTQDNVINPLLLRRPWKRQERCDELLGVIVPPPAQRCQKEG